MFDWQWTFAILPRLIVAAGNSLLAAFTAFPIALVLGLVLAIAQRTRFRSVKQLIREVVDFVRTTPLLLQIYFVFYVGPRYGLVLSPWVAGIATLGKRGLTDVFFATHAGMSEEEFEHIAGPWLERARHPGLGRRFVECAYQPQLELLQLLHQHDFRVFIVTGGGIDLVRSFAESTYGVARERVIGSSVKMHFELRPGRAILWKSNALNSFDDREAKPENISLHIGRRPLLAFGNSDGDLAMMLYTRYGRGPRLALLLHHDDAEREFAYDRNFHLSPLVDALDRADELGVTVVSMKHDWKTVFP